jgi:hexosaminidase
MINRTLNEARLRGIRVLLEFDTPGHTNAMGRGYPGKYNIPESYEFPTTDIRIQKNGTVFITEVLTPCYGDGVTAGTPNYPEHAAYENLDPTRNTTFDFIRALFTEIFNVQNDEYMHLGMDEV